MLAAHREQNGELADARKCYTLLAALGSRAHSSPDRITIYEKKIATLAPTEYEVELRLCDEKFGSQKYNNCIDHLYKANEIRHLLPGLATQLPWSDISSRMDRLRAADTKIELTNFPEAALRLAEGETDAPDIERWRESQHDLALKLFNDELELSDREFARQDFAAAINSLMKASKLGSIDKKQVALTNWNLLESKLNNLLPHEVKRSVACQWTLNMVKIIKAEGKRPDGLVFPIKEANRYFF
jgi:hypothetical protein